MKDIYVYRYADKTYINLTNRCSNDCEFCVRRNGEALAGNRLWLAREPEAAEVIAALEEAELSDEVVFCGYGEPTMRLQVLLAAASYLKRLGKRTRLNTNGLANAFYGRDVTGELKAVIDVISISLNAASAEKYDAVCHSVYGANAYAYMLDFARRCVRAGMNTVLTVVDVIGEEDVAACRSIAQSMGAALRVRTYIADNGEQA